MSAEPITVIHVDDDRGFLDLVEVYLEKHYEDLVVKSIPDPSDCLELFNNGSPVDCIVSDYDMPELDGLELLESIRSANGDLPFILYTGKGSEEIAAEAISKGVDDYMQKETGTEQYEVLAQRVKNHVERARAEQELRNSGERYRALVEQNVVGIYLIQDGEFTYVNPRLAELFGYETDEVIGMTPMDLTAEQDRKRVDENIRRRIEGEVETIQYEFTGLRKNGEEFPIEVQGTGIELNGEPAVAGVLIEE